MEARAAPTPTLPQRGREKIGEALSCYLAPLGRGLGRGARVRYRWRHALPPPRPSPEGEVGNRGSFVLLPRPSGERAGERGTREESVEARAAPTPALPQRGREEFGEALSCSLAPLGRGLGRGARVRKRWWHAMPPPRPSPRGGGRKSGRLSLAPSPLWGEGWGEGHA